VLDQPGCRSGIAVRTAWVIDERLKDPLIFGQCIHVVDVAVLLNRNSYVEQYD
jgi:hypothetical protein